VQALKQHISTVNVNDTGLEEAAALKKRIYVANPKNEALCLDTDDDFLNDPKETLSRIC
jgi:hypothetical protein